MLSGALLQLFRRSEKYIIDKADENAKQAENSSAMATQESKKDFLLEENFLT